MHLVNCEFWEWVAKWWPATANYMGGDQAGRITNKPREPETAHGIGAGGVILIITLASFGFSAHKFHELRDSRACFSGGTRMAQFLEARLLPLDDNWTTPYPGSILKITQ